MTQKKPHHHGDLQEALVAAGISLLEKGGISALSLRKCAAISGVSHAAPAHHFGGLDGLIAAIVAKGFTSFTDYMVRERDKAGADPNMRLKGILKGYLAFADQNAALFTLMFGTRIDIEVDEDLATIAAKSYQVLAETCAPFIPQNDPTPRATEILVWSLVHGYASLRQYGQVTPNGPIEDVVFEDILKRLPILNGALGPQSK
ncbi:MAG: TetR/AcrR family transcriptional regulator [Paracoccaceae bacterium]|jgi:AcrR family transcriptional regulator|nr:TetR/AcrR family transcriptional regulator [Paracoccaceae bacterium]